MVHTPSAVGEAVFHGIAVSEAHGQHSSFVRADVVIWDGMDPGPVALSLALEPIKHIVIAPQRD